MSPTLKQCSRASCISLPRYLTSRTYYTRTPSPPSPEFTQLLGSFASLPPRPTLLSSLLAFGEPLTPKSLLLSASYVWEELPRRLVRRVKALDALPFIVGMNPHIARNHELYRNTFETLATAPLITDLKSNWEFVNRLEKLVRAHANDVPTLARGFQEASKYMDQADISNFLDGAIRSRISIRFIAEQHIALTRALRDSMQGEPQCEALSASGVVDSECSAANMINSCGNFVRDLCEATFGVAPTIQLEGMTDAKFKYVPVHIEYVLIEILKNAFRATVENHQRQHGSSTTNPMPPVLATIALASLPPSPSPTSFPSSPMDVFAPAPPAPLTIGTAPQYLTIRIRDQGGGVHPCDLPRIFSYAFTTARGSGTGFDDDEGMGGGPYAAQYVGGVAGAIEEAEAESGDASGLFGEITSKGLQTGLGTLAGLGYGLPMARIYASYFGGSIDLVTLHGHGTDVFIKFRALDESTNLTL